MTEHELQEVVERMRRAEDEEVARENACLEELRAEGLLEKGFGSLSRREWVAKVLTILQKHGIFS